MKELKDLIAGDDVLVVGRSCRRIAKVDKVTKTQIVVNNARFRRDSGWQCGGDRWFQYQRRSFCIHTWIS